MSEMRSADEVTSELKEAIAEYEKEEPCCEDIFAVIADTLEWVMGETDVGSVQWTRDKLGERLNESVREAPVDEASTIEASDQRQWLPNVGLTEHPDGYTGPCGCDDCYRAN